MHFSKICVALSSLATIVAAADKVKVTYYANKSGGNDYDEKTQTVELGVCTKLGYSGYIDNSATKEPKDTYCYFYDNDTCNHYSENDYASHIRCVSSK